MDKSTKEMFEELGYENYDDDGFTCYKKENARAEQGDDK